jgi:hypothetical protein
MKFLTPSCRVEKAAWGVSIFTKRAEKETGSRIRGTETLIRRTEMAKGMRDMEVLSVLMMVPVVVIVRLAVTA